VPMCLVDENRLVVASSDAAYRLFGTSREQSVGGYAGRQILDDDPMLGDRLWDQLRGTNQVLANSLVAHPDGRRLRVSYAGHGTTIDGHWHALMVVLSIRSEPEGEELIRTGPGASRTGLQSTLTRRERDVIRRVAQGANSREIANELCVSQATVRTHVRNAMRKTNARTRAQLVALLLGDEFME
jgi:DNA-binding CsgD family transcriptional regulator